MRIKAVKDIGVIDLTNVEVNSGQMEAHISVMYSKGQVRQILNTCMEKYKEAYPAANVETDIYMDLNITYSFGGYTCPEFEAYVLVWHALSTDTGWDSSWKSVKKNIIALWKEIDNIKNNM
ncbi:MAG: hypothetical protein LBQ71_01465 [Hungatella sp.]|jgi:hypothetical protein|nr:hypothetical protein [Hungatella sp.]